MRNRQAGYSLLELMVGVGLMALIVYSFYQLPSILQKGEKRIAEVATTDRIFKGFSQRFLELSERSDVSMRFLYLPIPIACSSEHAPCVRKMNDKGELEASSLGGTGVQFYRDETPHLINDFGIDSTHPMRVKKRKVHTFSQGVTSQDFYATWPLYDESSQPFVLMRRSTVSDHFFLVDFFVTSDLSKPRWNIVKGVRKNIETSTMIGKPMLIYNTSDFAHYTVQQVTEAVNCSSGVTADLNACKTIAKGLVASFNPDTDLIEGDPLENGRFYAVKMEPLDAGQLSKFLPNSGYSPTAWGSGQDPAITIFPTQIFSIFQGGGITDLQAPVDAKRLAHYLHTLPPSQQGKVALLPIDLVTFYMITVDPNPPDTRPEVRKPLKKSLKFKVFGEKNPSGAGLKEFTGMDDMEREDRIVFARRLGRAEVSVFHVR